MSISFCLPHPVAVSDFIIYRVLGACTEMYFVCVAIGGTVLFILRSRLIFYSAESRVNRVQVVFSGFKVRWLCFVQAKTLCKYGCIYFLAALVPVCRCDGDVICVSHDLNWCSGWW